MTLSSHRIKGTFAYKVVGDMHPIITKDPKISCLVTPHPTGLFCRPTPPSHLLLLYIQKIVYLWISQKELSPRYTVLCIGRYTYINREIESKPRIFYLNSTCTFMPSNNLYGFHLLSKCWILVYSVSLIFQGAFGNEIHIHTYLLFKYAWISLFSIWQSDGI